MLTQILLFTLMGLSTASPLGSLQEIYAAVERRTSTYATCVPQPAGSGPAVTPDDPTTFLNWAYFATTANGAPTPAGYDIAFQNAQAANNAYGYLGYTNLASYDTNACAAACNNKAGCTAFNIYFERDPTVDPNDNSCSNPSSTTNIKCSLWQGPTTADNAVNSGQWRGNFQVVIAGSNGYINSAVYTAPGYTGPTSLGNYAINAPLDCAGHNTYMGQKFFPGSSSSIQSSLCAQACTDQNTYNLAHASTQKLQLCSFYNAYILKNNGVVQGQVCSLYNETWPLSYATNSGYTSSTGVFTISNSVTYYNASIPQNCINV